MSRAAPGGSVTDGANTGRPAAPIARYATCVSIPSRDPSTAPESSTTSGVSTNGTAVNGSGIVNWAAAAVSATASMTAPTRIG